LEIRFCSTMNMGKDAILKKDVIVKIGHQ